MSVPKSKRGESMLTVLTKADELATYTIKICSNEKNFPKHYRWCITSKIVDAAIDISTCANMANSVFVKDTEDYKLRKQYQSIAYAKTYALLGLINIAYRTFGIDSDRVKCWTGLTVDVQTLLRNWKKTDAERYNDMG